MAMNPNAKKNTTGLYNPVTTIINESPIETKKNQKNEIKKRKNFVIEQEMSNDFDYLCKLKGTDFSKSIVALIKKEVEKNKSLIEEMKLKLLK